MTLLYGHRGETEVHLQPIGILSDRKLWVIRATPWSFYSWEEPGTHHAGGWVGLEAGLEGQQKSRLHRNSIPGPSSPKPIAIPTTLSQPPFNACTGANFLLTYLYHFFVVLNSVAGISTRYGVDDPRIESRWERGFPEPFARPNWPWALPRLLFNGCRVFTRAWRWQLTTI